MNPTYNELTHETVNKLLETDQTQEDLHGQSFENACALAETCEQHNLHPHIAVGATDFEENPAPPTLEEAYNQEQHHFWVMIEGLNPKHELITHMNIAAEWPDQDKVGIGLISSTVLPPDHYRLYKSLRFDPDKQHPEDYLFDSDDSISSL